MDHRHEFEVSHDIFIHCFKDYLLDLLIVPGGGRKVPYADIEETSELDERSERKGGMSDWQGPQDRMPEPA